MIERAIEEVLHLWPNLAGGHATLVNLSENHTFRIDGADGSKHILRLHRPGYHSLTAIKSELGWVAALRAEGEMPVPRPLLGANGALVQFVETPEISARHAVLFAFEDGVEPQPEDELAPLFETLGGYAARNHIHTTTYRPERIERPLWDEGVLDTDGIWGDWRKAPGAEPVRDTLTRLDARLRQDLAVYGKGSDRFGLIHADMRLANLLVAEDKVTLIDFDDCGFGWFAYDFAAAVSFIDDQAVLPELKAAWIRGYVRHRPLEAADIAAMDTLVLLRRMLLLAWTGTHAETDLARSQAHLAELTARLGEAYMAQ